MIQYKQNYCNFFSLDHTDWVGCSIQLEGCRGTAVDIHHIEARGLGGSESKDEVENLIACCRSCHTKVEGVKELKPTLKKIQAAIMKQHENKT